MKLNDRIKMATSIIDYIFRELAITYLERKDPAGSRRRSPYGFDEEGMIRIPNVTTKVDMTALKKVRSSPNICLFDGTG